MAATPAFADTTPAGQEQTDPAEAKADEENRAAIERLLVYPNDYLVTAPSAYLREHAAAALAGTPADRAHFLTAEVDRIRRDDARVAISRIMSVGGPVVYKAAVVAFESDDIATFRAFLTVGQYAARTEDENRAEVQRLLDDPSSGRGVREGAQKALAGSAAGVEQFLKVGLKRAAEDDDRLLLSQIMSVGGPEVRKAAGAALSGSIEDVRAFLKEGQFTARAKDQAAEKAAEKAAAEAAAKAAQDNSGTTVVPASVTAGTTTTSTTVTTTDGQATVDSLAATGPTTPLAQLAGIGGAAVLLGAGTVVASRRRSQV
ncbi:ALF repeat-containing protein [Kitasatospora sp. P5_F3]